MPRTPISTVCVVGPLHRRESVVSGRRSGGVCDLPVDREEERLSLSRLSEQAVPVVHEVREARVGVSLLFSPERPSRLSRAMRPRTRPPSSGRAC